MDYSDIIWKNVLVRSYKPFFASIFGIYASKFYDKFVVVYKDGWCYWYLPKDYECTHDMNFYKRYSADEYKEYSHNTLNDYRIAYNNIEKILKHYKEEKNRSLSSGTFLRIFGDPDSSKASKNITSGDANNLGTFSDNFGIILAYPEMSSGSFIKETLIDKLSEQIYGKKRYNDLEGIQRLAIDQMLPILTLNDDESESISKKYEFDLYSLASKIKNDLIREAMLEITKTISEPKSGSRRDYFLRIKNSIKRRLEGIPQIINKKLSDYLNSSEDIKELIEKYSPVRSGWQFGKGLSLEEVEYRLRDLIRFDNASNDQLPIDQLLKLEIESATLKKYFESMVATKKTLLERISKKTTGESKNELLLYINILSYDGWIRYNRKNYASKINYISADFMKDVASFLKLELEDIYFVAISEIAEKLKNNAVAFDKGEIRKRKEAMLMIFENGKIKELKSGKSVKGYIENLKIEGENSYHEVEVGEEFLIKGTAIGFWEGEIVGNIAKIDNEQDLIDITDKDIIVAKMIEPYHGMVFRQPKGIIIEDAGIASHAVYVAHSRNIPLIVGAQGILSLVRKYNLVGEEKRLDKALKMQSNGQIDIANLWEGDKK